MNEHLEELYKAYRANVKRCQDMCDHDIKDNYCFLCNKFFDEEDLNED